MESLTLFGRQIGDLVTSAQVAGLVRAGLLGLVGFPLIWLLSTWVRKYIGQRYTPQQGMVAGKLVFYSGFIILLATVLGELGFSLTPLLGTAGIIGVAVGFASQTSVSNIISGLFLIAEQPFVVGDRVTVAGTTGFVMSIDILSVKLRTLDNKFVRIPNETIIKSEVTNVTRFPIRRLDLTVGVAYKEDISRVRRILLELAEENPLALQHPEPVIIFTGFNTSSIDLTFGVWVPKDDYLTLKNTLQEKIKERFDAEGIEIPFPHLSLYAGSVTDPFPVRVVEQG